MVIELKKKTATIAKTRESEDIKLDDPLIQGLLISPSKSNMFFFETNDNNKDYHNRMYSKRKRAEDNDNSVFKRGMSYGNVLIIEGAADEAVNFMDLAYLDFKTEAILSSICAQPSSLLEQQSSALPDPSKCILSSGSFLSTFISHIEAVGSFAEVAAILEGTTARDRLFFRINACLVDFQLFDEKEWNSEFVKELENSENPPLPPFMYIELKDQQQQQPLTSTIQTRARITIEKELVESFLGCSLEVAAAQNMDITWALDSFFENFCSTERRQKENEKERAIKLAKKGEWITTRISIDDDEKPNSNQLVSWIFEASQMRQKSDEYGSPTSTSFSSSVANNFYFNRHLFDFNVEENDPQWIFSLCCMYEISAV